MSAAFGLTQSAQDLVPVTPHDTNPNIYRGFYVGSTAGGTAIRFTSKTGQIRTVSGLVAGREYMWMTQVIHNTGTTVTNIFGIL